MTRKPRLTHKTMINLLTVRSMAMADADSMDGNTPQEAEHATKLRDGCEYIGKLAAWWAHSHGVDWPTEYQPTPPPKEQEKSEIGAKRA